MESQIFLPITNYFFEILNIAFCLAIIVLCKYYFRIRDAVFGILLFHFALIFLTNNVLFPISYMGDQLGYLNNAISFRGDSLYYPDIIESRVNFSGVLFAFFPMPIINSVYSLGAINFLIYFFLYLFFTQREVLKGPNEWFYLLYPSLMLYTVLALRDTFILFFMIMSIYYYVCRNRKIVSLMWVIPLIILKFQNAAIVAFAFLIHGLLNLKRIKKIQLLLTFAAMIPGYFIFSNYFNLENINKIRLLFFLENSTDLTQFTFIQSWEELLMFSISSSLNFIMEPYPWKIKNPLQLIQSIENIIITIILIGVIIKSRSRSYFIEKSYLMLFFVIGIMVYSFAVVNSGTAARYRFPFITVFCIFYLFIYQRIKTKLTIEKLQS